MARPDTPNRRTPTEIDDTEDRMGSVHELDFSARNDAVEGRIGDERVAQGGTNGGEALTDTLHEDGVDLDDLSPDTLYDQTGARDPREPGGDGPVDEQLREVEADEIGGGIGLDEAELARSAPLDGEPWTDQVIDDDDTRG